MKSLLSLAGVALTFFCLSSVAVGQSNSDPIDIGNWPDCVGSVVEACVIEKERCLQRLGQRMGYEGESTAAVTCDENCKSKSVTMYCSNGEWKA
jgi:hypothetical protein